jgi:twitching motility protein PilJ
MAIFDRAKKTGVTVRDTELITLIGLLVIFIVLLTVNFVYVGTKSDQDKQYISLAGELRVLSQRIAKDAEAAISGAGALTLLKGARDEFDSALMRLRKGDSRIALAASPAAVEGPLRAVEVRWSQFKNNTDVILANQDLLLSLNQFVGTINEVTPKLTTASEELVQLLVAKGISTPNELFLASRQVMLSQRIASTVNKVFERGQGSDVAAQAADTFRRDAAFFVQVLEGLREGNTGLGIARVTDPAVRTKLDEIAELFGSITQLDLLILERFPDLFKAQDAANEIFVGSNDLLKESTVLVQAYTNLEGARLVNNTTGYILGAIALVLLVALGYKLRRDAQREADGSKQRNERNESAILRLLDEMGNLADGDLTARATVSEDITGAIADAVNYAVDSLRDLVTRINDTTVQVASAAQMTQSSTLHLSEASQHQAHQITEAGAAITEMSVSIEQVSANAAESVGVAKRSVAIAGKGSGAVQNTIQGMDVIREQIQETSKRIKRLGESSQEIGDIVELINDIADQTNILALNAAIQAAMAGEAGRGFAVVADEVQRLAERSGNATRQIEALVKAIQTDTNEAIISMEQSTSEVVAGAKLAQEAGGALKEIEAVSSQLAGLIQDISQTAQQQALAAAKISDNMDSIQEITTQTSVGTSETASSVGNFAELANELRKSVAGFKLPR